MDGIQSMSYVMRCMRDIPPTILIANAINVKLQSCTRGMVAAPMVVGLALTIAIRSCYSCRHASKGRFRKVCGAHPIRNNLHGFLLRGVSYVTEQDVCYREIAALERDISGSHPATADRNFPLRYPKRSGQP